MPYYHKCGASILETDEFAVICQNCSDVCRYPHLTAQRRPIGRPTFPLRVRRYSAGDSAITFAIIMALILFGAILLGGIA